MAIKAAYWATRLECPRVYSSLAKWGIGDVFNISIGQGDNAYTPVQMARYLATVANEGKRNQLSLVKGVSSEGLTKKRKPHMINLDDKSLLEDVKVGMHAVVTRSRQFGAINNDAFGKTGTAQRAGKINPPDEVEYVKRYLSAIAPGVSWENVQAEIDKMKKMKKYEDYSANDLVDTAVIKASNYKITSTDIDRYKRNYDSFAWFIAAAPVKNPKIATSTIIVQGGISSAAVSVCKDVIVKYQELDSTKEKEQPRKMSQKGINVVF